MPDIVSYSLPRSCPWASPPPLAIMMAIIGGTRFCPIRLSRIRGSCMFGLPMGPSWQTINGASVPVLGRDVNGDLALVVDAVGFDDKSLRVFRVHLPEYLSG